MNTESGKTDNQTGYDRNDEVRREFDPIAVEVDRVEADREEWKKKAI